MGIFDASAFGDLARDVGRVERAARRMVKNAVRETARDGQLIAKVNARRSAGKHGRKYPRSITRAWVGPLAMEYGPESDKDQGAMSFETGSRNQPPHLDLARSADQIEGRLPYRVQAAVEDAFDEW